MNQSHHYSPPEESPVAEATTVAWLVSVMMTTMLGALTAALHIYMENVGVTPQRALFAGYLLYSAAAAGAISLLLAIATFKLRNEKPPPKVTTFSIVIATAPLLAVLLKMLRG